MSATLHRIRQARIERQTAETSIDLAFDLDGSGRLAVATGIPFLDHLLDALCRHGRFDLEGSVSGDSDMDPHHTVEDVGIVVGQLTRVAIGDRAGIARFGFAYAPLDEALARCVVDFSGRPFLEFSADMPELVIGSGFASSLIEEFWRALVVNAGVTAHIDLIRARNAHHAAESIFKAAAIALCQASRITNGVMDIPSTKGLLA